ncbi:hypothetical protein CRV24_009249 [Beauveria bassiana]|uniref:F-box domain-containing protein n=1 Tax=Beauveria bassiana (strain ARSEF 2860) TaxID=655819 RepID=J4W7U1_BEAB2|nr:F-box domain-containing protein [Beauveria bassiana ARSEF 2860]EJP66310.1 F-box domain-containing protein [Beauveria bassiana ARSEF 2860]KAF1731170.1 hypothetical protein CRV24_009249 [Beauveria bassiana]KAH8707366.1 hypothetical protein HC256_010641 [Beauveria bassiana]
MVQWLANPTTHAQRTTTTPRDALLAKRPARRGYSVTDFQGDAVPFDILAALQSVSLGGGSTTTPVTPSPSSSSSSAAHVPTEASIPENAVLLTASSTTASSSAAAAAAAGRRPELKKKKPPRRSYSATDKEPEDAVLAPNQPRPSPHAAPGVVGLLDLPPELHYALLDFLDPIDAVCLGLAHRQLYTIHRRKNSRVPLSSRYDGPNDLEWVWRGVRHHLNHRGNSSSSNSSSSSSSHRRKLEQTSSSSSRDNDDPPAAALDKLRVKGQVYCRKCGIARCELHRHIRSWMGDGYQYCEITERFGRPAPDGAKSYCFMSSPKDRRRCGRHSALKASSSSGSGSPTASTTPATTPPAVDASTTTLWA